MIEIYKDTHKRTLTKVFSYRVVVAITAFLTSMLMNYGAAFGLTYVIASFTLGYFSFWIQERIWNYFKWGKVDLYDKHQRTIAKTITWRLFSIVVLYFYGLIMGLSQQDSLMWTIVVNISFIVVHYTHERVWNMINWGKIKTLDENENIQKQ